MNKTYTETFTVRATDCDFERRMRLDALFVAMQEGGERHALALGAGYDQMMARGLFFALARIHVSTLRAPRQGETVVHTTWPGEMNRFFCPRYHVFSLEDGTPLAAAGALWVMLDTKQRRIVSPQKVDLGFPDAPARASGRNAAGLQSHAAVFRFRRKRPRQQHQIHRVALRCARL